MKKLLILCLISLCFTACNNGIKETPINEYYDVNKMVNQQVKRLTALQPSVEKAITVDGKQEKDTVQFDSTGWKNELEVFKLADINKPTLKDLYTATEEKTESGKVWHYVTEKPSLGIEFLHVYFDKDSTINRLEARYHEKNALYLSERNFEIKFDEKNGQNLISSYKVEGEQKMIMKDRVSFSIESKMVD